MRALEAAGWHSHVVQFTTSEFGELLARRRWALLAASEPWARDVEGAVATLRSPVASPCGVGLRRAKGVPPQDWVKAERLVVNPRLAAIRDPLEPRAAAHAWLGGERTLLVGTGGPLPWPKHSGAVREAQLLWDAAGPPGYVRTVSAEEWWALAGRDTERLVAASAMTCLVAFNEII